MKKIYEIIPGVLLCLLLTAVSFVLQKIPYPPFTTASGAHPVEPILLALLFGAFLGNIFTFKKIFTVGVNFSAGPILYTAIVLLGAQLNLRQISQLPLSYLLVIVLCIIQTIACTLWLAKKMRINSEAAVLVAAGTAVCGSSAIAATAPLINAQQKNITLAMSTINLCGLIGVFCFPLIGHLLHLSAAQMGLWAGCSLQAVPQVIAAGYAYGHAAGVQATIVKLVRVVLLAPTMILLRFAYNKLENKSVDKKLVENKSIENKTAKWSTYLPPFILLFFLMIVLSSIGLFKGHNIFHKAVNPQQILTGLSHLFLITGIAAVGIKSSLRGVGHGAVKTFALALSAAVALACFSLLLVFFL